MAHNDRDREGPEPNEFEDFLKGLEAIARTEGLSEEEISRRMDEFERSRPRPSLDDTILAMERHRPVSTGDAAFDQLMEESRALALEQVRDLKLLETLTEQSDFSTGAAGDLHLSDEAKALMERSLASGERQKELGLAITARVRAKLPPEQRMRLDSFLAEEAKSQATDD